MNELVITQNTPSIIVFDKQKALDEATAIMEKYNGLELTDEQIPEAKKEIATLNKVSKAINDQAIAIDKEASESVKLFRTDVKEIKAIIDSGVKSIKEQVNTFEEKVKVARQIEITSWNEYKDISEFVSFSDDWLKKSWNDDKKLKLELVNTKTQIDQALSSIKMFATSHNLNADKYVELFKTTPLDIVQQRIIEDHNLISEVNDIKPVKAVVMDTTAPITTITRELTGTIEQLKMLKAYAIDKLNIKWEETK